MRIVSLAPSATEILCVLGLADSVVGISHECDFPPEIRHRPTVTRTCLRSGLSSLEIHDQVHRRRGTGGKLYAIDTVCLAGLSPDLVVSQRQCGVCAVGEADAAAALAEIGSRARLLGLSASRFGELPADIRRIGDATRRADRAQELIRQFGDRLERVRERTKEAARPRVFCLSWFDPLMAAGHWMTEIVELAGGIDSVGGRGETSDRVDARKLEAYAPEVMLLLPCGFVPSRTRAEWEALRHQRPWRELPAVRSGHVFVVDGSLFHRPGPRMIDGLELLAKLLHPECWERPRGPAAVARMA